MTRQRLTLLTIPLLVAIPLSVSACSSGSSGAVAGATSAAASAGSSAAGSTSAPGASATSAPTTQKAVPAEKNPPGDIPDNLAFVAYRNTAGRYTFTHPEGWLQKASGSTVTFTDKLNGVQVMPGTSSAAATVASATAKDVPALAASQPAFEARGVKAVSEPAGKGVRIVYRRNSAPDPVTGRQYRDEVERYELFAAGREIIVEFFGPVGADNVDAYRTMIQSVKLS